MGDDYVSFTPHRIRNLFILIVLIVILFALIGVLIYYLGLESSKENEIAISFLKMNKCVSSCPPEETGETEAAKRYLDGLCSLYCLAKYAPEINKYGEYERTNAYNKIEKLKFFERYYKCLNNFTSNKNFNYQKCFNNVFNKHKNLINLSTFSFEDNYSEYKITITDLNCARKGLNFEIFIDSGNYTIKNGKLRIIQRESASKKKDIQINFPTAGETKKYSVNYTKEGISFSVGEINLIASENSKNPIILAHKSC